MRKTEFSLLILLQVERGGGVSLYFGELAFLFFCCKLRHTEGGRECIFWNFVAAKIKEAERILFSSSFFLVLPPECTDP